MPEKSLVNERAISFSIAPISEYCDGIGNNYQEISSQGMDRLFDVIKNCNCIEKSLKKLKNTRLANEFPRYSKVLIDLENIFEFERLNLANDIREMLPKIRNGSMEEVILGNRLTTYDESPIQTDRFHKLLNYRKKEIETAEYLVRNNL